MGKVIVQNCGRALVKPQKPACRDCAGSTLWTFALLHKTSSSNAYSQPRHWPVPESIIQVFHITVNSPLLQSGRLNFRLETNSTVMWLYASGVSLICQMCDLEQFFKIGSQILQLPTSYPVHCSSHKSKLLNHHCQNLTPSHSPKGNV